MIEELGENFRGLWTSYEICDCGNMRQGWAVTIAIGTRMVETPYAETPVDALRRAIEIRDRHVLVKR